MAHRQLVQRLLSFDVVYRATMGDFLLQNDVLHEATKNTSPPPTQTEVDDLVRFFADWFDVDVDDWVLAQTGRRIREIRDWSRVQKVLFFYRTVKRLTLEHKFTQWQALLGGPERVKELPAFRQLWPYSSNRVLKGHIRQLKIEYNRYLDRHNANST